MTFFTPGRAIGPNVQSRFGGSVQPINFINTEIADANGNATFVFEQVALSNTWTVTVNCATAPDTARFTAQSSLTVYGQFKGGNSWGPMQFAGGDQLTITATGLVPGTQYAMNCLGVNDTVVDTGIVFPAPYADTVTTSTEQLFLGSGKWTISGTTTETFTLPLSSTYRSIYLIVIGPPAAPPVNVISSVIGGGNVTLIEYPGVAIPYSDIGNQAAYRMPLYSSPDTLLTVQVVFNSGASGIYSYYYGADLAEVEGGIYSTNVTVDTAPGNPLDVVGYGGANVVNLTTTSTTTTQIVAAPPTGYSTRIHSVAMDYTGTASTTPVLGTFNTAANKLIVLSYPYQNSIYVGGILVRSVVNVQPTTTTSTIWSITYDTVLTPTIS